MGKFAFGFDYTDLPEDQWNLKYLIRQGPKDLRLFVSLFTHNRLGRLLFPELVLSWRGTAHDADRTSFAPITFAIGGRRATVFPECLLFDHASTVRIRVAVVHALYRHSVRR